MLKKLIELFIKTNGRNPNTLEMLQLKFKAARLSGKGKVIEFPKDRITDWTKSRPSLTKVKTSKDKIDWLVKNVDPNAEQTIPPKETLEAMLRDGREDLIDHFFEMHTKKLSGKPKINIDTSGLKHPELVKKIITDKKLKPNLVKTETQIKSGIEAGNKAGIQKMKVDKLRKDVLKEIENRKNQDYIGNIIDPEDYGFKVSDNTLTDEVEEILQMLRDEKAYGGVAGMLGERTGFKLGGIDKARRLFLQAIGAGAATVGAAKTGLFGLLKGAGKKNLIQVPIKEGADGMPSWFKPLVNKVIKEGTEVESGVERVIVHKTKLPNSQTDVYVTQQLDTGDVAVDIGTGKHGFADGHYGQPVRLEYRAAELIEPDLKTGKGGGKTKEEFTVEEAEWTGGHPENVKFEESTIEKFGEHGSDFTEVEKFATGTVKDTKPTKKRLRTEYEQGKAEADADAAADMADDFASGGIARMLGE